MDEEGDERRAKQFPNPNLSSVFIRLSAATFCSALLRRATDARQDIRRHWAHAASRLHMASARPLSADDLKLEVKRRFSDPARYVLSSDQYLQRSLREPNAATATTPVTTESSDHSSDSPGTIFDSEGRGVQWSRVANARRFQLTFHEAGKVGDVAGAAAQLMRLSSAFSGMNDNRSTGSEAKPSPSITPAEKRAALLADIAAPAQKRAALLADIVAGDRTRSGLKHVSEQDKARPKADPHATMLADIKGGHSKLKSVPRERRGTVTAAVRRMLGVYGRDDVLAERPTPLCQVIATSSELAPWSCP